MALVAGCKHSLEVSVPVEAVREATERVVADVQKRARIPGFRPGKAPPAIIRKNFAADIREQVLKAVIPKYLQQQLEQENLQLVGTPDITDIHFHDSEPLRFTAEFEVVPEIELKDYKDIEVPYHEPQVTDEDVEKRIEELREQKAEYANVDPRPLEDGDYAVVSLESVSGTDKPVKQDETMLHIGGEETVAGFSEALRGLSPGDEKEFDVTYPEDFGAERLAGQTVHFRAAVKGIRRKELPEVNDDFAQDLGDYRDLQELREAVRKSILAQRQYEAQSEAKNKIVEKLVEMHEFPVPDTFVDRQIRTRLESGLRQLQGDGLDIGKLNIDWQKMREAQKDKATAEVKASLLLGRIAEREAINATVEEVDQEVHRIARQAREPFAAARLRFEKDGTLNRIANHIQTEKILSFLFEHARKTAA